MNRRELIDAIQNKMPDGTTKILVDKFITAFVETISEALTNNEEVRLVGFGTFCVKERAPKIGRNPRSGEEVRIPARKAPVFKPGKELKEKIN